METHVMIITDPMLVNFEKTKDDFWNVKVGDFYGN